VIGPFRFFREAIGVFSLPALTSGFTVWFIPVVLGSIFVFLFVSANPLLERWISLMNPGNAASYVSIGRVLFWARRCRSSGRSFTSGGAPKPSSRIIRPWASRRNNAEPADFADFFGVATILRSLILFNLLFCGSDDS